MPVELAFRLKDDRIDGVSIRVGGGPGELAEQQPSLALELRDGVDDAALSEKLRRKLRAMAEQGAFSGVVLLARDGKPIFNEAFGLANRERGAPNTPETRLDVGSITKLLTKIAIARLLEDGKLRLEDSILEHIPDYPDKDAAARITIADLLEHRSGLGDIFTDRWESFAKDALREPRDFFPLFTGIPLGFEPGRGKRYSNAGYVVLGAIVEAASGKPYTEYVRAHVLAPAGMKRSGFLAHDGKTQDLAVGYTREGAPEGELRSNQGQLPPRGSAAGSSAHTASDLLRLDQALRTGRLLGPKWAGFVLTGSLETADPRFEAIGIAGGGPGVNAALESDGRASVIVLANLDPPVAGELASQLFPALVRAAGQARP